MKRNSLSKKTNTNKFLKNILAASSLAAITFGAVNAVAANNFDTGGAVTIPNGLGAPIGNLADAAAAGRNFADGDNVKFGGGHTVTNQYVGNIGDIDFAGQDGAIWNQDGAGTINLITGTDAGGGAPVFNVNADTAIVKVEKGVGVGTAVTINVADAKKATFAAGNQTFGAIVAKTAASEIEFQGGDITGTINGTADGNGQITTGNSTFKSTIGGANKVGKITVNDDATFEALVKTQALKVDNAKKATFAAVDNELGTVTLNGATAGLVFQGGNITGTINGKNAGDGIITTQGNAVKFLSAIGNTKAVGEINVAVNTEFNALVKTQALNVDNNKTATCAKGDHVLTAVTLTGIGGLVFQGGNITGTIDGVGVGQGEITTQTNAVKFLSAIGNTKAVREIDVGVNTEFNALVKTQALKVDNAKKATFAAGDHILTAVTLNGATAGLVFQGGNINGTIDGVGTVGGDGIITTQTNAVKFVDKIGDTKAVKEIDVKIDTTFEALVKTNALKVADTKKATFAAGNHTLTAVTLNGADAQIEFKGGDINGTIDGVGTVGGDGIITTQTNDVKFLSAIGNTHAVKEINVGVNTEFNALVKTQALKVDNAKKATFAAGDHILTAVTLNGATAEIEFRGGNISAAINKGIVTTSRAAVKFTEALGATKTLAKINVGVNTIFEKSVKTAKLDITGGEAKFASGNHSLGEVKNAGILTFQGGTIDGEILKGTVNAYGTFNNNVGGTDVNKLAALNIVGDSTFKSGVNTNTIKADGKKIVFEKDVELGTVDLKNVNMNIGTSTINTAGGQVEGEKNIFVINVASDKSGQLTGSAITKPVGTKIKLLVGALSEGEYTIASGGVAKFFDDATLDYQSNTTRLISNIKEGKLKVAFDKEKTQEFSNNVKDKLEKGGANSSIVSQVFSIILPSDPAQKAEIMKTETGKYLINVVGYGSDSEVARAIMPTETANQVNQSAISTTISDIGSRLGDLVAPAAIFAPAAGDAGEKEGNLAIWGGARTNQADQKVTKDSPAYKLANGGGTIGADFVGDRFILGGAFSFDNGNVKYKGIKDGDKTKVNTNVFSVYTNVDIYKGLFARGIVSYGTSDVKAQTIRPGGGVGTAEYTTRFVATQLEGGYNHSLDYANAFVTLGGRFTNSRIPEYTETGAGVLNNTVRKSTSNQFDVLGSVGVNTTIVSGDVAFIPNAKFSVSKKVSGKTSNVKYRIGDLPVDITIASKKNDVMNAEISTGLNIKSGGLDFGAKVSYGFANKYKNVGAALTVRASF